jgi:hypothetical protein
MSELELELGALAVDWPETPDLAAGIESRLAQPGVSRRPPWLVARPAWQIAVACVAVVIAVVAAVPPARSAVLDLFGISSVEIVREEPRPSRFASGLGLGDAVTLPDARRRAGFDLLVPSAVGEPDAVYLADSIDTGRRVDFVYRPREGLPEASTTGAGLLVTQFEAVAEPAIQKTIGASATLERLMVGGDPAFFISGEDHGFAYIPARGDFAFEPQRLAGTTLLVDRGDGVLLRIEGDIPREEAVRIALSAAP